MINFLFKNMDKNLINAISSKYISEKIFDYIKDKNYKLKLFLYSKALQEKYDIKLFHYQETYINQFKFNYNLYLNEYTHKYIKLFKINNLKDAYEKDLLQCKVDNNIFESVIINYFNKNEKNLINDKNEKIIEIYSPLFEPILKTELLEKIFTIYIPINIIEEYNLKTDYITVFNKLNKTNGNYSLKIMFNENNDINLLKELNINFNKIRRMTIIFEESEGEENSDINNYNKFYSTLFSLFDNKNNLIYLNIENKNKHYYKIMLNFMNNINNFASLKSLSLFELNIAQNLEINLSNLETLELKYCTNIVLNKNTCINIKDLYLFNCLIISEKSGLKFLKLKSLVAKGYQNADYSCIDFSVLENLEYFDGKKSDFILLGNNKLETAFLDYYDKNNSYEIEKKTIEKIINIKTLKKLKISLSYLENDDISHIKGENTSLNNLQVEYKKEKELVLYNLEKLFPNINRMNLYLNSENNLDYEFYTPTLDIQENKECKISKLKISISMFSSPIKLYQRLENLVKLNIEIYRYINNLDKFFPLLSDGCPIVFESLEKFILLIKSNSNNVINNLYNNICNNCLPNLKIISLNFFDYTPDHLDEDFYKKLIRKVLSLNLNYIDFFTKNIYFDNYYSKKELKGLYPDFNSKQYNKILIGKQLKNNNI